MEGTRRGAWLRGGSFTESTYCESIHQKALIMKALSRKYSVERKG